jgi:NAD(P)-dependent dehydrogenase (short-subunit alcohol dehydrogenase family)
MTAGAGRLIFLQLDLGDLNSVKRAAATFAEKETVLHVLWNNAATSAFHLPKGYKTAQGLEPMVGMHCVAAHMLTELLRPQLRNAADSQTPGAVRVVWSSSIAADDAPENGIDWDSIDNGNGDLVCNYVVSKAATWLLAREASRRYAQDGIISVAINPGNLKTNMYDGGPWFLSLVAHMFKPPVYGAYTCLFAGLSPDVTVQESGALIVPWGRVKRDEDLQRQDIVRATKTEAEGGLGYAERLWEWCGTKWKPYA